MFVYNNYAGFNVNLYFILSIIEKRFFFKKKFPKKPNFIYIIVEAIFVSTFNFKNLVL